ncbi:MAG: HAMP domain-containing sensor histidine kinase [Actinomycetota bacterium]
MSQERSGLAGKSGPARRGRPGLRTRVTVAFALGALLLSAGLAVLTYQLARSYLLRQRETSVMRQTYANARLVNSVLRSPDPDIPRLLVSLQRPSGSFPVVSHRQEWFGSSVAVGRDSLPAALRETVSSGEAARQRFVLGGTTQLVVGVPLPAVEAAYYEVFPFAELERTLRVLGNSLAAAAAATTVAGATMGRWASRRALSPMADVSAAAAAVAGGRFDVRLDESGDPDLSSMAVSFNRMTDALQARIERDARFASDVSHELRSPLTTLAAALQVVSSRREEMPERARRGLDLLNAEVGRFERLVEDLLEMARIDSGVGELATDEVVLGEFVLRAVRQGRNGLVPVEIDAEAAGTVVKADKRRLERVVANLVENAVRHGGGVTRVSIERDGPWARFAVEDAGPGVPPEDRERVFERFARGDAAGNRGDGDGTGLGLALVREHVRLHGGRSRAEDRPGGGARFVIELPVVK